MKKKIIGVGTTKIVFFMFGPDKVTTLPDGRHKHNLRVMVTMLIANADNVTMNPYYGGILK